MTPYLNPRSVAEKRFNTVHARARVKVEMTFGQWKRRFLMNSFGYRTLLRSVPTYILCTCVLHNIAKLLNLPEVTDQEFNEDCAGAKIPDIQPPKILDKFITEEAPSEDELLLVDPPIPTRNVTENQKRILGINKRKEITQNRFSSM